MKTLAHKYTKEPVLILGGRLDTLRKVAQEYVASSSRIASPRNLTCVVRYGFGQAYTTLDVLASNPSWVFLKTASVHLNMTWES
jgi:hypothetical protein